ncbi:MAG: uroporphyrinogen-III synthase [Alphaproteobacteria bacterium]|nr:uroporphyrinogen-III synthase [Alphaproteobacteria bacterium]
MKTVLLTRPLEASEAFSHEIEGAGVRVLIAPMLEIVPREPGPIPPMDYGGYIFTSANGVRAFAGRDGIDPSLPAFVVGDQTGQAAKEAGFSGIVNARGAVEDVIRTIVEERPGGALLHPCGVDVSADIPALLARHGCRADRFPVYEARPADELSAAVRQAIADGSVYAALFFSARAGESFSRLVVRDRLEAGLGYTNALSLSERVVKSIMQLSWGNMYISDSPDRSGMLKFLRRLLEKETVSAKRERQEAK